MQKLLGGDTKYNIHNNQDSSQNIGKLVYVKSDTTLQKCIDTMADEINVLKEEVADLREINKEIKQERNELKQELEKVKIELKSARPKKTQN